ncbi:MAG: hypothetical protein Fur005_44370 [Roseiflexaceae bacterium]
MTGAAATALRSRSMTEGVGLRYSEGASDLFVIPRERATEESLEERKRFLAALGMTGAAL